MTLSNRDGQADRSAVRERPQTQRSPAARVLDALRSVAFWIAVFLPLVVGGVILTGLESPAQWRLFVVLATSSVIALYLGQPHGGG